jgi:hypothetical protein
VAWVVETFHGEHSVVILDSIQTIPLAPDAEPDSPRLAAKALMSACRRWAGQHSITFILTSQSNRASYRSKKTEDNSEAIASFSETGAIEYMADIALVLSLPDDSEIVKARLVKNRLKGSAKPFDIRFALDSHSMLEADQAEIEAAISSSMSAKLSPYKSQIKSLLKNNPNLTQRDISERCQGDASMIRQALKTMTNTDRTVLASPRSGRGGGFTYSLPYEDTQHSST